MVQTLKSISYVRALPGIGPVLHVTLENRVGVFGVLL